MIQSYEAGRSELSFGFFDGLMFSGLCFFICALFLFPVFVGGSFHNQARIAQTFLFSLAALYIALRRWNLPLHLTKSAKLVFGLLVIFSVTSGVHAINKAASLRELGLFLGVAGFVIAIVHICFRSGFEQRLVKIIIAGWALYSLKFLLMLAMVLVDGQRPNAWLLISGFDNPRFLNHSQTIALPLLAGICLNKKLSFPWRGIAAFALVVNFMLLAMTFGRATILALLCIAVLSALVFAEIGRKLAAVIILAGMFGYLFFHLIFEVVPAWRDLSIAAQIKNSSEAGSDHSRFLLWNLAIEYFKSSPILGVGPMNFAEFKNPKGAHPHNIYLQVLSEFGLPFFLLFFGSLVVQVVRLTQYLKLNLQHFATSGIALGSFLALVAAAIDGIFSGNFVMPTSQVWIALTLGLFLASLARQRCLVELSGLRRQGSSNLLWRGFLVLLLCSQLWMAIQSLKEVMQPEPRIGVRSQTTEPSELWRPRYWLDGWLGK
ncbi:hypothetical protein DBR47_09535 [Paucibacter sp. KBW04]|uniref:O-antigen ligase family protein n=1 Tax=Paucibacter sp. KBW04 TaxID=2153361 RepID=UPI000F56F074|nr:O-antigen ligase family protein [Paucibacter sp. KBW04]RQO60576.1 hypothetical protein DBR47_09535 [Paucibacter sp. KBW04]